MIKLYSVEPNSEINQACFFHTKQDRNFLFPMNEESDVINWPPATRIIKS